MSASITSGTYPRASARSGHALNGFGLRLWRWLSELGARRAAPQLNLLAMQYQHSNPELARQLRAASRELLAG